MLKPWLSRLALAAFILAAEFVLLEAGLRLYGAMEGSSTFQSLFMDDPAVGIRLRPGTDIRYTTVEFTTDIVVNAQGVRDDAPIGPKGADERRIVILGDSLVLSVQVQLTETFGKQLETQLNARGGPDRWRVINAGVQGYGPVDMWLFFDKIVSTFEPDVVLIVAFVGNDAIEAADGAASLETGLPIKVADPAMRRLRRIVRSSVVLQAARVRFDQLRSKFSFGTPERPLATYLTDPPPVVSRGLEVSREAFGRIASQADGMGARTAIVLMPARLQVNDEDYRNLAAAVRAAGGEMDRQAATRRFSEALKPLGLPMLDLQPILARQPEPDGIFFQRNVHLTPRGHRVTAGALLEFLDAHGLAGAPPIR